ncbi:hypothetical protein BV20DRAFT_706254 [Pilatotrama ljubarskyi]|nr:hypothetical protein BV20DRAFT_706254 [Pilatotrama ljubarskyi]
MSSSDGMAAIVDLYQAEFTAQCLGIAITTLLFYEILVSLDAEIWLMWRNPKSLASILFLMNRYIILLDFVLSLATISPMSDLFAAVRVYALSRSKLLYGTTLVLGLAPFVEGLSVTPHFPPANYPPPANCTWTGSYNVQMSVAYNHVNLLRTTDGLERPSLYRVCLQNGSVYFCVLLSLTIVDITFRLLQITLADLFGQGNYVAELIDPLSAILTSRFLLDLRAANEKLTAGGSSVTAGSLHFAGADIHSGRLEPFLSFSEDTSGPGLYDDEDDNTNNADHEGNPEVVMEGEMVEGGTEGGEA